MAQVSITLKLSLDEANLLMDLLDEGEKLRNDKGRQIVEDGDQFFDRNTINPLYQKYGQEVNAIQAFRRGIKAASR